MLQKQCFFDDKIAEIKDDISEYAEEEREEVESELLSIGNRLTKLKEKTELKNGDYIKKKRRKH